MGLFSLVSQVYAWSLSSQVNVRERQVSRHVRMCASLNPLLPYLKIAFHHRVRPFSCSLMFSISDQSSFFLQPKKLVCRVEEESLPLLYGSLRYGRPVSSSRLIGKKKILAPTQPSARVTDGNGVAGQDTWGGGRVGGMEGRVVNREQERDAEGTRKPMAQK